VYWRWHFRRGVRYQMLLSCCLKSSLGACRLTFDDDTIVVLLHGNVLVRDVSNGLS
jgi:hypothetical protein